MKSQNALIVLSISFLLFAAVVSVVIWPDVSSPVKIAFFAFGYGAGVTTGAWMAKHRQ